MGIGEIIDQTVTKSVLEKLVDEAFSQEQKFLEIKQKVREVVDVNTRDAGHAYVFEDNEASVSVYVSDKLVNGRIKISGKLPPDVSLIGMLAFLKGNCSVDFGDTVITEAGLDFYGLPSEVLKQKLTIEQKKLNIGEKAEQKAGRVYSAVMELKTPDYLAIREIFKDEHIFHGSPMNAEFLGLGRDKGIQEIVTLFEKIAEVNAIAKQGETEYIGAGIERLKNMIKDAIEKRVDCESYSSGQHYVDLPHIVLEYKFVNGGIKIDEAHLGKSTGPYSWMNFSVKEIANLTEEEKRLLSLADSIEVQDNLGTFNINPGKNQEFSYVTEFRELGYNERETARNLLQILFPNFVYSKVEAFPSRRGI
jgi:hypothetical protein